MEELLKAAMPPDEEMVDLIELAFLVGQLSGKEADLAYWLAAEIYRDQVDCGQRIS